MMATPYQRKRTIRGLIDVLPFIIAPEIIPEPYLDTIKRGNPNSRRFVNAFGCFLKKNFPDEWLHPVPIPEQLRSPLISPPLLERPFSSGAAGDPEQRVRRLPCSMFTLNPRRSKTGASGRIGNYAAWN